MWYKKKKSLMPRSFFKALFPKDLTAKIAVAINMYSTCSQHKFNFINPKNEPRHEKEHVKISNTAKFQSCRPHTRAKKTRHLENPKIRDKVHVWQSAFAFI